jgi:hypothetical protein
MWTGPDYLPSEAPSQPLTLLRRHPRAHHGLWAGSLSGHMLDLQQRYNNIVRGAQKPVQTAKKDAKQNAGEVTP